MKTTIRAITKKLMPAAFILAVVFLLAPVSAQAAKKPGKVTKLEEVKATDTSITVKFKKVKGAKKYQVRVYRAECLAKKKDGPNGRKTRYYKWTTKKELVKKTETKKTQFTVKGLEMAKSYAVKVRAVNGKAYGKWETLYMMTAHDGVRDPGISTATGNNLKKQYDAWINKYVKEVKQAADNKAELAFLMFQPIRFGTGQFECTGRETRDLENFQEYDMKSVYETYKTGKGTNLELYRFIQEMCRKCGLKCKIRKYVYEEDGVKHASYDAVAFFDGNRGYMFDIIPGCVRNGLVSDQD